MEEVTIGLQEYVDLITQRAVLLAILCVASAILIAILVSYLFSFFRD